MWVHVCTHVCIVMYITCTMHTMYSTSIQINIFFYLLLLLWVLLWVCIPLLQTGTTEAQLYLYVPKKYIYRRYEGTCVHEVYILIYMDTPIYNVYYVPYALALYEFFAVNLIITVFTLVYASNPY